MRKRIGRYMTMVLAGMICLSMLVSCGGESKLDRYRAEKHERDSVGLVDQQRTLAYFQSQHEALMPVADSLIALFKYEPKDPKYQDHGFYTLKDNTGIRILVRDDGGDLLIYRNGKRIEEYAIDAKNAKALELLERAHHLKIVMSDIAELEHRMKHTQLEIDKYQRRQSQEQSIH